MRPWHDWPGFQEFAHKLLGKARLDIEDAQIKIAQELQIVLQPTNQHRERRLSVGFEGIEQLMRPRPDPTPRTSRHQSEEPDEKKRKHFMVDVEELANVAEERVLSARRVISADTKFKEATSVGYSPTLGPEHQVQSTWKDEAKEERLAATSDAPRPPPQERGPFTTIRKLRDEHEKKQREEVTAYERQISQVDQFTQEDSMGKPAGFGPKPVNRLDTKDQSHERGAGAWIKPKANSSAGLAVSQVSQATSQNPNKRQRVGNSTHTHSSPHSPGDLEHDVPNLQRRDSTARSGNSQTLNENGKRTSDSGLRVKEYQNVREITKPPKGTHRRNRPGNSSNGQASSAAAQKFNHSTVGGLTEGEGEDPNDPIVDSDGDAMNKPFSKNRSFPIVEINPYQPEQVESSSVGQSKDQLVCANGAHPRTNGRSTSIKGTPATSPHFPGIGEEDSELRNGARQPRRSAPGARGLLSQTQVKEKSLSRHFENLDPDVSVDDLLSENQKLPAERKHTDAHRTAQELSSIRQSNSKPLLKPKAGTIALEDSDEDSPLEVADIKPTNFKSAARGESKAGEIVGPYELCQLFCAQRIWLRNNGKHIWTMEHHEASKSLKLYNEHNVEEPLGLLAKYFHTIHHHRGPFTKVILLRNRDNNDPEASHVCMEFTSTDQCFKFTEGMVSKYRLKALLKDKEYLNKAFNKCLTEFEKRAQSTTRAKRPRDVELDLLATKSARRHEASQNDFSEAKKPRIDWPTDHQPKQNVAPTQPKKRGLVEAMETDSTHVDRGEDVLRSFQHHSVPPESFYGKHSDAGDTSLSHGTRSSTRNSGAGALRPLRSKPRSPSPEVIGWTQRNPGWAKDHNWKGSLIFPPQGKSRATVDKQDIERLDEEMFLNDNLVTFYLRWLEHQLEAERPDIAKRVHFFNSFFYEKLKTPVKGSVGNINYKAVEKWTNKVNIFEYDYIVVPVNESLHWYVAIICNPPKLLEDAKRAKNDKESRIEANVEDSGAVTGNSNEASQSPDSGLTPRTRGMTLADKKAKESESNKPISDVSPDQKAASEVESNGVGSHADINSPPPADSEKPKITPEKKIKKKSTPILRKSPSEFRIITLDSFHTGRSTCCTKLKRYLLQEMKSKLGIEAEDPGTRGMTAKNIPFQSNSSDCGLFLLSYVERFLEDPDEFIRDILRPEVDLTGFEKKYPPASSMRDRVRELLFELQIEQNGGGDSAKGRAKTSTKSQKTANTTSTTEPSNYSHPMEVLPARSGELQSRAGREEGESPEAVSDEQVQAKTATEAAEPTTTQANKTNAPQMSPDLIEPSHKQSGTITQLWENVTGKVTGLFRSSATSTPDITSSAQVPYGNGSIENDDSTHTNDNVLETIDGKSPEIVDSQAQSSRVSFIAGDSSSLPNATKSTEPIVIDDSPEQTKSMPKPIVSTNNRTRKPKSTSPRPVLKSRISMSGISTTKSTRELKSPSPRQMRFIPDQIQAALASVQQLGSPSPEPVDLLQTFTPDSSGSHKEVQRGVDTMDNEMLLPNGGHGAQNFPNYLEESQSSTSTPIGKPLKSQKNTSTMGQDIEEPSAPLPKGKKRKSSDDDQGQAQRRKRGGRGGSAEIPIDLVSTQEEDGAKVDEPAVHHRSGARAVERSHNSHIAMGRGAISKQQKSAGEIIDVDAAPSSGFQLDASDDAIIGIHRRTHIRFKS